MTVTSCTVKKADAGLTLEGTRQTGYVRLVYTIKTDDIGQMPLSVISQAWTASPDPLPKRFDAYNVRGDTDTAIFCQSTELRRIHTSTDAPTQQWECDVTFGPPQLGTTSAQQNPDPLQRPPVTWIESEVSTRYVQKAFFEGIVVGGTPAAMNTPNGPIAIGTEHVVQNSAGEALEAVIQKTDTDIIVATQRAWSSLATMVTQILTYQNTLNSDTWINGSVAAKHAKWLSLTCNPQQEENGIVYYTGVERVLVCNQPVYEKYPILNLGTKYWESGEAKQDQILAPPYNLDQVGGLLSDGEPPLEMYWRTEKVQNDSAEAIIYTGNVLHA